MFYLIEITNYVDETPSGKGVYGYTNMDAATAAFHQKMAGAINNTNYRTELCMIISERGAVQRYEYWERTIAE